MSSKRWKLWIVAMLLPWLAGCSMVRVSYGQGPQLAYWWLDGYVDFSDEQAPLVRRRLDEWFAWHRATQLPDYAALLAAMQREAVDDVTPELICRRLDEIEQRVERAVLQGVPAMAEIVERFSPAQVRHLERRYAKSDDELAREHLEPAAPERRKAMLDRARQRFESFYGPLDEAQRRLLADTLADSPFDARLWADERRARQRDIVAALDRLIAEKAAAAEIEPALRAFVAQVRHSPRAEYRSYRQRLARANCALAARVHNATSAAQRQRLVEKFKGWESDLRSLTAVPGAAAPASGAGGPPPVAITTATR